MGFRQPPPRAHRLSGLVPAALAQGRPVGETDAPRSLSETCRQLLGADPVLVVDRVTLQ